MCFITIFGHIRSCLLYNTLPDIFRVSKDLLRNAIPVIFVNTLVNDVVVVILWRPRYSNLPGNQERQLSGNC